MTFNKCWVIHVEFFSDFPGYHNLPGAEINYCHSKLFAIVDRTNAVRIRVAGDWRSSFAGIEAARLALPTRRRRLRWAAKPGASSSARRSHSVALPVAVLAMAVLAAVVLAAVVLAA